MSRADLLGEPRTARRRSKSDLVTTIRSFLRMTETLSIRRQMNPPAGGPANVWQFRGPPAVSASLYLS